MKMKDGRTHFSYKAEHAVDLDSDLVVAAEIYPGDTADGDSMLMTRAGGAGARWRRSAAKEQVADVVGDKGYHQIESLAVLRDVHGVRTYIPERADGCGTTGATARRATRTPSMPTGARMQRARGPALSRRRSEYIERSFAHTCETGGGAPRSGCAGSRTWRKRYLLHVAARNLGVLMRDLFGVGTPRSLQGRLAALCALLALLTRHFRHLLTAYARPTRAGRCVCAFAPSSLGSPSWRPQRLLQRAAISLGGLRAHEYGCGTHDLCETDRGVRMSGPPRGG